MNIGDLFFSLRANDAKLQADVKKAGDKAGTSLGSSIAASFRKSFSGAEFGKGIVQGLGLAGGLGAANLAATAISTVTDTIGDAINAASSLNETMSKSEVIFGDSADEISAWADTAADAFGQSKRQALDTASGFAGLFDTVGIGIDQATDMAKSLTVLGSDLASFFNTDVQTAIDALRSGLSGESEPLRRFNVFLSETAVNSKLLAMNQQKVNGQWTESQKALARYQLILEQTTSAQGDFARTSDGLANSQRQLEAQWEDALARLGQAILPLATDAVSFLSDGLGGLLIVLDEIGKAASHLVGPLQAVVDIAKTLGLVVETEGGRIGHTLKDLDSNRTGHRLREDFDELGDSAIGAADDVETSAADILASFTAMRDVIVGGGTAVANALYDPILKAGELAETQAELRANKLRLISEDLTADERQQLLTRNDELRKSLIIQNAEILTYGTEAEQISKTKAFLASGFWAQAYEDATPEQRAALDEWRTTLTTRLDLMERDAAAGGKGAGQEFSGGLRGQAPSAGSAAGAVTGSAKSVFLTVQANARAWGYNTGAAYAAGLRASVGLVSESVSRIANELTDGLKASSPPGPKSPLHLIDVWGEKTIEAYADGVASGRDAVTAAYATALGGVEAPGARAVPAISASSSLAVEPTSGARVQNNYVTVEGLIPYRDPLTIPQQLQRFGDSGLLDFGVME